MQLSEQEVVRREKLSKLRALGINPYPADLFPVNHNSKQIKESFAEDKQVVIAGRLMSIHIQGKASFAQLQDSEGRIQVYFNRDVICPSEDKSMYNDFFKKWLDLGDILGIEGKVFKTMVGEISVNVEKIHLLSKSLKPLPQPKVDADGNTYDAFNDPELRYRRRYVDLIVNDHVKETFLKRSKVINSIGVLLNLNNNYQRQKLIAEFLPLENHNIKLLQQRG